MENQYDLIVFDGQAYIEAWSDRKERDRTLRSMEVLAHFHPDARKIVLIDRYESLVAFGEFLSEPARADLLLQAKIRSWQPVAVSDGVSAASFEAFRRAANESVLKVLLVVNDRENYEHSSLEGTETGDLDLARFVIRNLFPEHERTG